MSTLLLGFLTLLPLHLSAQQLVELPGDDRIIEPDLGEVYSVGGAFETADWEVFGELGWEQVAFDAEGRLHIFDRANYRVVVVGPDGELLHEFGKEGEGPEEWRSPVQMTVFRDGRVAVADFEHRAFLIYDSEGELETRVSMGLQGSSMSLSTLYADPRSDAVYTGEGAGGLRITRMSEAMGGGEDAEPTGREIERWTLGDEVSKETFFTAWEPPPQETEPQTLRAGNTSFRIGSMGPRTFEPRVHLAPLPNGLALVDTSAYTVKILGREGELRRVLRRPSVEPREVTERIREREKERRLEELMEGDGPNIQIRMRGSGGDVMSPSQDQLREMMRGRIEQMRFYHEIPVVRRFTAGWDGTLWIERTPDEWWTDGRMDVLTPEGEYLGTLEADGPGIPAAFGPDGLVAYIETDEFDVPTIRVRRLPTELR